MFIFISIVAFVRSSNLLQFRACLCRYFLVFEAYPYFCLHKVIKKPVFVSRYFMYIECQCVKLNLKWSGPEQLKTQTHNLVSPDGFFHQQTIILGWKFCFEFICLCVCIYMQESRLTALEKSATFSWPKSNFCI